MMDAPISERFIEVCEERNRLQATLVRERMEHERDAQFLRESIALLKQRKAFYKGIAERVRVVLNAANLLDVDSVGVEVLADALEGDTAEPIDGRRP